MMIALDRTFRRWVFHAVLTCLAALLGGCAHLQPRPFTFVQMCDPQLGFGGYEADLARFEQAVTQINAVHPDFVVVCGDLVTQPDEKSFSDFNAVRARLNVPCYCAPGNHDIGNAPTPVTLSTYRRWVGKDYFSFSHKGCTFVVINTQLWKTPLSTETAQQESWLYMTLRAAARKGRPIFVIGHYPPFVKTPDEPNAYFNLAPEKRRELLGAFQQYGVVAVLAGHTHTTSSNQVGRIQVVTSETTSKNFDNRPFGFRLWSVTPGGTCQQQFIPLNDRK